MTTILVTGPESSGTRMLSRMLTEAGAAIHHRPMPMTTHGHHYPDGLWTDFGSMEWDAAVVIHRDWKATIDCQVAAGHVTDHDHAIVRTRRAIANIYAQLATDPHTRPWFTVTYESLARPAALVALAADLGLDPGAIRTHWNDANAKYYGGTPWSEHRPLWHHPVADGSPPMHRDHLFLGR